MERSGLIAGGNFIVDLTRVIDNFPAEETLSNIIATEASNGGAAYNVLKDLALMGASFPLTGIGMIGDDEAGMGILSDLDKLGINHDRILKTGKAGTSFTDVMVSAGSGKRTFFHYRGANALLSPEHFSFKDTRAKIFHYGYPLLLDSLDIIDRDGRTGGSRILEEARKNGLRVTVDLVSVNNNRFAEIVSPVFPYTDYLFMNEIETEKLTGINILDHDQPDRDKLKEVAGTILEQGVGTVIIHFPAGAASVSGNSAYFTGRVNIPKAIVAGTTGAGDAFAAGFLYGLHEGLSVQECLKMASCSAATCLLHPTCSGGIQPIKECLALGEKYGFGNL